MNLKLKFKPTCVAIGVILFVILSSNAILVSVAGSTLNFTSIYRKYLHNTFNIIEPEVQPCANFFQHACGNFENFQSRKSLRMKMEKLQEFSQDELDLAPFLYNSQDKYTFFETNKYSFDTIPGILVRNVYDLCKAAQRKTKEKSKIWRRMIYDMPYLKYDREFLKHWPFLQYQWDEYEPQLNQSWPSLAAELSASGLKTIISVFFAENTIYVSSNNDLQCLGLNDTVASLIPLLRNRNGQIAQVIGREIWLFCHQLKGEIAVSGEKEQINFLTADVIGEFFQQLFLSLNFTDSEIENARKIIIDMEKLSENLVVVLATSPRIVYNFILWQAYQQIANDNDCFSLTSEFDSLLNVEYWNWHAFESQISRDVALALYLFHITRFQKHYRQFITSTTWERLFQSRAERKDLNLERTIKNYAKEYLDVKKYSNSFKSELFLKKRSSFYSYLLELRRLKMRYAFFNPYEDTEDLQFFKEFINFSILLFYRPRLHYFASYDREMWKDSKLLQSSDGVYDALDCLSRQTALNEYDSDIYDSLNEEQVNNVFNFYKSFKEALSDYKFWLASENFAIAEDFILDFFDLDSMRIMFYAVAQQFCGRNDPIHKNLINRSFMNMPEFQEAFKCSSMDEMNPVTKCMIDN